MADYCNKCSKEMWGDNSIPEIDVYEITANLPNGGFKDVICENCEMVGLHKSEDGRIWILYPEVTKYGDEIKKVSIESWENKSPMAMAGQQNSGFIGGVQIGSPLDTYKVKIIMGIRSVPQMYHVIQEYTDKGTTQYSYLSEEQIRQKHSIEIVEKFDWILKQKNFVN